MIKFFRNIIDDRMISDKSFKLFRLLISLYLIQEFCWIFASREQLLFDGGFNPSSIAIKLLDFGQFSFFNFYSNPKIFEATIILSLVLAIGMNFSKFSKISAILLWIILGQLYFRNTSIFTSSHALVQILILFIALYRPIKKNNRFFSWAITLFISSIFIQTTYLRDFQSWFFSGDHLYYLMNDQHQSSILSHFILETLRLYQPLSSLIYSLELLACFFIIFSYGKFKNFVLIFLIFFEIFTNLFFKNYAYTYLLVSSLILLINFDRIKIKTPQAESIINQAIMLFIITSIGLINIFNINSAFNNNFFKVWTSSLALRPYWKTIKEDYNLNKWFRILGKTNEESYVDLLSLSRIDYFESHIPDNQSLYNSNHLFKNYFDNIERFHFNSKLQGAFYRPILKYFCNDKKIDEVSIIKVEKIIPQLGKQDSDENQVQNYKESTLAKMSCSN